MNNELEIFKNEEFGEVRTLLINDKPYFCASDIAKVLGYSNTRDAISRHCKGVVKSDIPTNSGIQTVSFIPEGDIYRLIIKSKLPSAERFETWVMDEVLPTMRKTGGYINNVDLMINTYFSDIPDDQKILVKGLIAVCARWRSQMRFAPQTHGAIALRSRKTIDNIDIIFIFYSRSQTLQYHF